MAGPVFEFAMPPAADGSSGGTFSVDLEHAPGLIAKLQDMIYEAARINAKAVFLQEVTPPGSDPYSTIAAREFGRQASMDPGKHGAANLALRNLFQHIIDNTRASMQAYHAAEEHNRAMGPGSA